ncbi:MAG: MoaD/ThiS family protein [Oscillospiraceae bacterium]|nr:MoaD/ThiS family protein [Oscillospiraceae bacterium]
MIKVKIFGLLRMDTGLKELELEGERVKDLYPQILAQAKLAKPGTRVKAKDIDGCIIMINGVQGKKTSTLCDGDTVMLMSPVCGG